jgi:hypothetical protein
MAWDLKVSTTAGDHQLSFPDKAAAESAMDEALNAIQGANKMNGYPVKIAGQLVVIDNQVTSANIWEAL